MKKNRLNQTLIVFTSLLWALSSACTQFLEVEPLTKVSGDQLLTSEKGILTLLAELYNAMPMEDFNYHPGVGTSSDAGGYGGFYIRSIGQGAHFATTDMYTSDAIRSDGSDPIGQPDNNYFEYTYTRLRDLNLFLQGIEKARDEQVLTEATFTRLQGEAYFIRAYLYFGLVKSYGGVPILEKPLDNDYAPGTESAALYVPRSTEKDTWDFILGDLDKAIAGLPQTLDEGKYRAGKGAAYALKSRVALYAASVAKYWDQAPLIGEAATAGYVGMPASEANRYYAECLGACKAILEDPQYALYKPDPASREEAAANYQNLFLTANDEIIFGKAYLDGSLVSNQGHSYDAFYSPAQNHPGYLRHGRFSVTLDIVDVYEDYTDDGNGASAKIKTRDDGNEDFYYANPNNVLLTTPFKKYADLYEPFAGKDVRLLSSVIVPGALYKDVKIIMQSGLIRKNGEVVAYAVGSEEGLDGNTYYTYGAASSAGYSGFDNLGGGMENSNFSCTGFSVRKYLAEDKNVVVAGSTAVSTTAWIDFRLAEIYLNYAEAAVESGQGDAALAKSCINQLRKRAGHTDEIPLSIQNVMKERRVELAFEGRRYDDMLRRREYHTFFNAGRRHALAPLLDLREESPKYIFVRVNQFHDEQAGGRQFNPINYYKAIPGTATNRLVQNPGH